jgi:CRP-like cAMP-binding protein
VIELSYLLATNKFLSKFKETGQLDDLCRYMRLEQYGHNEVVFEQGEKGTSFYVILSGEVLIYKHTSTLSGIGENIERVADLKAGDSFGELALLFE